MRKYAIAGLAACTTTECNVATGAGVGVAAGALVGAAATGDAGGALVGATVGGVTGAVVGAAVLDQPGYCCVTNRRGRIIYRRGAPVLTPC